MTSSGREVRQGRRIPVWQNLKAPLCSPGHRSHEKFTRNYLLSVAQQAEGHSAIDSNAGDGAN